MGTSYNFCRLNISRNIACLNPADIRPALIFPATRPLRKAWIMRGGVKRFNIGTYAMPAPEMESIDLVKDSRSRVDAISIIPPMYGTIRRGARVMPFSFSIDCIVSLKCANDSNVSGDPPPTSVAS